MYLVHAVTSYGFITHLHEKKQKMNEATTCHSMELLVFICFNELHIAYLKLLILHNLGVD